MSDTAVAVSTDTTPDEDELNMDEAGRVQKASARAVKKTNDLQNCIDRMAPAVRGTKPRRDAEQRLHLARVEYMVKYSSRLVTLEQAAKILSMYLRKVVLLRVN